MACASFNKKSYPVFKRGDTWTLVTTFWETDEMLVKTSFYEGVYANAQLRTEGSNALVLSASSCEVNYLEATVTTVFSAEDTAKVDPNRIYVMDIQVTYPDGTVQSTEDLYIGVYKDRTFD